MVNKEHKSYCSLIKGNCIHGNCKQCKIFDEAMQKAYYEQEQKLTTWYHRGY